MHLAIQYSQCREYWTLTLQSVIHLFDGYNVRMTHLLWHYFKSGSISMTNVKYWLIINENLDTKYDFHLFMHTRIITIKHNIQSHFNQVITHRSVTRSTIVVSTSIQPNWRSPCMQVAHCADVAFGTGTLYCVTAAFHGSICILHCGSSQHT